MKDYVIGVDYGTDSVRSLIVDAADGSEIADSVFEYPRWKKGMYCNPPENRFRQHPLDYLEGLEASVKAALEKAEKIIPGISKLIRGIAVDTTGSTPVALDRNGTPLALLDEFSEDPDAMFILWKDHTSIKEASEINALSASWGGDDYTKYEGGVYSSEWFWAKILHVLRNNPKVRAAAYSWAEHSDWIPSVLAGKTAPETMYRSRCAAGHKAMWHEDFGGLPPEEFLVKLDPLLAGLRGRLSGETCTADKSVGRISGEWAVRLGVPESVIIGGSAIDCHVGAVGGGIRPFDMVKVMGTSTCDVIVSPYEAMEGKLVGGICGQVDGSVLPGAVGLEAGQSAFGDVYAWFKRLLMWPVEEFVADSEERERIGSLLLARLAEKASALPSESGLVALDWFNGRRTPWADQEMKGALAGLTLASDAPALYRGLVEATAFGSRKIMERLVEEGIEIRRVIAIGGVAKKSPFVMQILSDVMKREIVVTESDQAVALGAAIFAAVAAGLYRDVESAQAKMASGFSAVYTPDPDRSAVYDKLYARYGKLGESCGRI